LCRIVRGLTEQPFFQVFGFADDYSFGVLQSSVHWQSFITRQAQV
jgi:hypothetical protein